MARGNRWWALAVVLIGLMLWGCSSAAGPATAPGSSTEEGDAFPVKDPSQPFAVDEKGTVTLTNDQAYTIEVQRADGEPLYTLSFKKNGVIDPSVDFTVQTVSFEMPAELVGQYVAVGDRAFELYAADEPGYGFALRPELKITYTDQEIAQAQQAGAALDTVSGNVLVLYKEQRSPKWVAQTSVAVDESTNEVTVSNIAGAGTWMLVAKPAQ
ncbi:MAG: hypothetical protein ACK2UX_14900 [Anaerolineae bacterium]|jgi:hypothetical protein